MDAPVPGTPPDADAFGDVPDEGRDDLERKRGQYHRNDDVLPKTGRTWLTAGTKAINVREGW
jgi:hypothetical protein